MAIGKSNIKQSSNLNKDLDAEVSEGNKDQPELSHTEDSTEESTSNDEDSFDSNYDEDISMKKQSSYKVYDSTPAKRGHRKLKAPACTANKNQRIFIRRSVMTTPTNSSNPKEKGRV